jgi:hypothetical protein
MTRSAMIAAATAVLAAASVAQAPDEMAEEGLSVDADMIEWMTGVAGTLAAGEEIFEELEEASADAADS